MPPGLSIGTTKNKNLQGNVIFNIVWASEWSVAARRRDRPVRKDAVAESGSGDARNPSDCGSKVRRNRSDTKPQRLVSRGAHGPTGTTGEMYGGLRLTSNRMARVSQPSAQRRGARVVGAQQQREQPLRRQLRLSCSAEGPVCDRHSKSAARAALVTQHRAH